jgi:hypothetical protein
MKAHLPAEMQTLISQHSLVHFLSNKIYIVHTDTNKQLIVDSAIIIFKYKLLIDFLIIDILYQ